MKERKPKKLDAQELLDYALRALASRAHSAGELRTKLLRRAARQDDIPPVMARLKEYGYLDDRKFAESYSATRLESHGLGKQRVLRELRQRRVAPPVAETAVEQAYREADETELVEAYLARKYRGVTLSEYLAEPRHLAGAFRRLRAAGFSSGAVIRVLKRHRADEEALDALDQEPSEPGEPPPE